MDQPDATFDTIEVVVDPRGFATIALNRPDRLNTLTIALRAELERAVDDLCARPGVHVLILTGRGKAFSAGLDLAEWETPGKPAAGAYVHDPVAALQRFPGPVLGAINGLTITGGLELALSCDVLIAADTARFADTHCLVGLLPGWGGSVRLLHHIGAPRAREMALTGRFVTASEALAWGLVNHVVPAADLMARAEAMAVQMLAGVPEARASYKALLRAEMDLPLTEALQVERQHSQALSAQVTGAELSRRLDRLKGRG